MEVLWPLFMALGFVAKTVHKLLLSWWLDPWLQTKANAALWDDVQANLYWLSAEGQRVSERRPKILPFDYASVCVDYGNIRFWITCGRGELNVSLAPRYLPQEESELAVLIAALESTDVTEQKPIERFSDITELLRPRINALNEVFSEKDYAKFKEKLTREKQNTRLLIREAEWNLRKSLRR
jgi:hypothetical protein